MKNITKFQFIALFLGLALFISCDEEANDKSTNTEQDKTISIPSRPFNVELHKITTPTKLPAVQSFAWARQGSKLLVIGGRIEGFHGLIDDDTTFKTSKANTSIYVIDFSDYSYSELPLNPIDTNLLQFSSSNMEFYQDDDTLFVVGGFGRKELSGIQSNYTFDKMLAIQVSAMITEVEKASGDPYQAIIKSIKSPYLQVSGGDLVRSAGIFYLMFGQNYTGSYTMGLTGIYTNAIRQFKWNGLVLSDTASIIDSNYLHRRDLNVVEVYQTGNPLFVGYGGAFTKGGNGFVNPVRIYPGLNGVNSWMDSNMSQKTSQYECAVASIYDHENNSNTHVFFGGIGQYQYHVDSGTWEDGDSGALLPFVQTITQMTWQNGNVSQRIQIPPGEPQLPALLGANAIFFANNELIYEGNVINFQKLNEDTTSIGIFYGGIKSPKPTSSNIYPTTINKSIYEVKLIMKKE